jgi:hypothetical protein
MKGLHKSIINRGLLPQSLFCPWRGSRPITSGYAGLGNDNTPTNNFLKIRKSEQILKSKIYFLISRIFTYFKNIFFKVIFS